MSDPAFPPITSAEWRESLRVARERRAGQSERINKAKEKYMNKQWITDRLPTAADANANGQIVVEYANGIVDVVQWEWASRLVAGAIRRWLPLNDLPPVPPKPKTQEQLDWELWNTPRIQANNTRGAIHAFANAIREDLKRQVREIIATGEYISAEGKTLLFHVDVAKLRELVKEDKQ